jgi:thiol:disulfide interchange protein DsbD
MKISSMNETSMTPHYRRMPLFLAAFALLAGTAQAGLVPQAAQSKGTAGISALLRGNQSGEPDFLSPDQAFRFDALPDGPDKIRLIWGITDGYYLYRGRIKASTDSDQAQLGELTLPTGETKVDEYFGKQEVYHHDIVGSMSVARSGAGQLAVPLKVTYQGCATAGLCYPPITKTVSVLLPPAGPGGTAAADATGSAAAGSGTLAANATSGSPADGSSASTTAAAASAGAFVSEQDHLAALIRDGRLAAVLATFFGIGLLL